MYGHKPGCGLSRDQGAWPKWKPYDSAWIVLSLGPDGSPYLSQLQRYKPTKIHQNLAQF